ncbi:MAG TPA: hypothetical protein VLF43_04395 [Candidatus Saccharimonadales bacterium]|nr:hypothetical protein [Candidatus Saccharimonadales bacterium]
MSNTLVEYELTYLAREIPIEIRQAQPLRMVDFYVPEDQALHPHLRLRRKGKGYEITKKLQVTEGDASVHTEQTIPLDQTEFESLSSGHSRIVEKDRYEVIINGRPAEVDIFSGKLTGLVMIDFEFLSEADKQAFTPPSCCLADVTQAEFVMGGMLSGKSYDDISTKLTELGYQPLHV